ncbi:MAG: TetR/AcrR family transcriptional regulator [Acidimicrobiia bacterium]|nr:TetR/AcrR family transcriptional regulator [Acidimicrobiia bacterium]
MRRAPFADNPAVGARGLRTQQRILDGALQVFAEQGYDRATLDRIAQVAGCSRVSIYQYFSGKDDVFRQLAGQVARQLRASMEALDPITPDAAGLAALQAWITRYADIRARYEPVFRAFDAAAATDEVLVGGAVSTSERNAAFFQARLSPTGLPARLLEPMVPMLMAGVNRALDLGSSLRAAEPEGYPRERVEPALAAVVHRSLFGPLPEVNMTAPDGPALPSLRLGPELVAIFDQIGVLEAEAQRPDRRALAQLLDVGDDVVVRRGYEGARVEDVVAAAGVSRGAFYRYFDNIESFVRIIAVRAVRAVSEVVAEPPDMTDRASLRRWLRRYDDVHAAKGPMIRVWVEAVGEPFRGDHAAVFDWGRRRMARLLAGRAFGDADLDGLLLLAMVEAFGSVPRTGTEIDAAVHMIERAFTRSNVSVTEPGVRHR